MHDGWCSPVVRRITLWCAVCACQPTSSAGEAGGADAAATVPRALTTAVCAMVAWCTVLSVCWVAKNERCVRCAPCVLSPPVCHSFDVFLRRAAQQSAMAALAATPHSASTAHTAPPRDAQRTAKAATTPATAIGDGARSEPPQPRSQQAERWRHPHTRRRMTARRRALRLRYRLQPETVRARFDVLFELSGCTE